MLRALWVALSAASMVLIPVAAGRHVDAARAQTVPVEMVVESVVDLGANRHAVLLREKNGVVRMPIFVDADDALTIRAGMRGSAPKWPGGHLARVCIDAISVAHAYSGHLLLRDGDRTIQRDARTSDAIALALQEHAPIYAARKVIAVAGVTQADVQKTHEEIVRSASTVAPVVESRDL